MDWIVVRKRRYSERFAQFKDVISENLGEKWDDLAPVIFFALAMFAICPFYFLQSTTQRTECAITANAQDSADQLLRRNKATSLHSIGVRQQLAYEKDKHQAQQIVAQNPWRVREKTSLLNGTLVLVLDSSRQRIVIYPYELQLSVERTEMYRQLLLDDVVDFSIQNLDINESYKNWDDSFNYSHFWLLKPSIQNLGKKNSKV